MSTVTCDCSHCKDLNTFLHSPTEREWRLKAAEPSRKHVSRSLYGVIDYVENTDKNKAPYTLVVTKSTKSWAEKHRGWNSRVAEVQKHLKDLESRHRCLDSVLADRYRDVMAVDAKNLRKHTPRQPDASGTRSADSMYADVPQVAGQKRKAVVVDLTDG